MAKLILLIGLPGSGKSTYGKALRDSTDHTCYFSSDSIRKELYGDESIQGDGNKVFELMRKRTKEALSYGYNVIYDATNVTRKTRKSIIEYVQSIEDLTVEAHVIWAPFEVCIERDKYRERSVGEAIIRKFLYRWQSPFYDEKIDYITIIHNGPEGFEWNTYRDSIVKTLNISHDNPHHKLPIDKHCSSAFQYACEHSYSFEVCEAVRYHDIGKPMTKKFTQKETEEFPVAHYYQHDSVGGYLIYGFYSKNTPELPLISWLVSNHMQPYFDSSYYKSINGSMIRIKLDQLHEADVNAH